MNESDRNSKEISRDLIRLEERVDAGFTDIRNKLDRFDTLYARNDAVMALHAKSGETMKKQAAMEVQHATDMGLLNSNISTLSEQVKNLSKYVIGGVLLMIVVSAVMKML